jgi:hypothetical protein
MSKTSIIKNLKTQLKNNEITKKNNKIIKNNKNSNHDIRCQTIININITKKTNKKYNKYFFV